MHRGVATFTLDYGQCPPWLFERMVKLGREMIRVIIDEYGPEEFIKRIGDPVWFQSLGTVLAFDWNASGLTTILTAALKEAIRGEEKDLGIFICGGKGKTSKRTPEEITTWGERLNLPAPHTSNLVYNSRMSAKVDSALIQDGFQIYHHAFFFSKNGAWAVVQQGMNTQKVTARRYHWSSQNINDLVCEPHTGIVSEIRQERALNLTSQDSTSTRSVSTELVQAGYKILMKDVELLRRHSSRLSQTLALKYQKEDLTFLNLENTEFHYHPVVEEDFAKSQYLEKILSQLCAEPPENYEKLLARKGVGPKTVRALSLVSEIIYGAKPSYEDPARYSFAHGGKDCTPYPIDRQTYDQSIRVLQELVRRTRIEAREKDRILKKLEAAVLHSQQKML